MKRTEAERLSAAETELATAPRYPRGENFVRSSTPAAAPAQTSSANGTHLVSGDILWTLTKGPSTAEARRWTTPSGFELEVQIWTGPRREGEEDLCWTQVFTAEDALAETALAKKRQLESAGWLEDLDSSAV